MKKVSFLSLLFTVTLLLCLGVTPALAKDKKPAVITKFVVTPTTSAGTSDVKVSLKINEKAYVKISIYNGAAYIAGNNKNTRYNSGTVNYTWKTAKGIVKKDGIYTVKVDIIDLAKNKSIVKPKTFKIDNAPALISSNWTSTSFNPANGSNVLNYTASEDVYAMLIVGNEDGSLMNILFSCDVNLPEPTYGKTGSITWDGKLEDVNNNLVQATPGTYKYLLVLIDKADQDSTKYTGTLTVTP